MIDYIELQNFTSFQENHFHFCKGINVFIGKNGTGKTHILKNLATAISASNNINENISSAKDLKEAEIATKLMGYFKPDTLGNLVKKGNSKSVVKISTNKNKLSYSLSSSSKSSVKIIDNIQWSKLHSVYIPPREMFSLFEGFIGLSEKREISFDETYIAFAKALNVPLLKESYKNPLQNAIDILEKELKFNVVQQNGRFYIKNDQGMMEAHLVAEGLRKLASIIYLILNGEIKENCILFWDEPEANLNPALIKVVAEFILALSKSGIQIFLATHDYLLTHILSLYSEHKESKNSPDMKFFCLQKEKEYISVEEGETLIDIDNNPILEEYAAYYDLEQSFINSNFNYET